MISNIFFAPKIKTLRNAHHLSLSQLAAFLGKKKSAIAEIEAGRTGTTLDGLTDICTFFAISSDWLLGFLDDQPYNNEMILSLEKNLLSTIKECIRCKEMDEIHLSLDQKSVEFYNEFSWMLNNSYINSNYRNKVFSLSARANILFCMNAAHYYYLKIPKESNTNISQQFGLTIFQTSSSEVMLLLSYLRIIIRYLYDDNQLTEYNPNTPLAELRLDPQTPFYDITKAPED